MKTLYHGTSADNLESIGKNGFYGMTGRQLWSCSAGNNYFWCQEKMEEEESAFKYAADNATTSLFRAKDCRRLVFKLEIPDDYFGENFSDDTSCRNMSGAVMKTGIVPFKFVTEIWRDFESLDILRGYFGLSILSHPLSIKDFTSIEKIMVKAMGDCDSGAIWQFLQELNMEKLF